MIIDDTWKIQTRDRGFLGKTADAFVVNMDGSVTITKSLSINGKLVTPGQSSSSSGPIITGDNREYYSVGPNETWLVDYIVDLSLLSSAVIPTLTAFTKQEDGAGGVYYLRIGGTPGGVDGAILLTMSTDHLNYLSTLDQQIGNSFSNPGGKKLLKISSNSNLSDNLKVFIRNIFIEIKSG